MSSLNLIPSHILYANITPAARSQRCEEATYDWHTMQASGYKTASKHKELPQTSHPE